MSRKTNRQGKIGDKMLPNKANGRGRSRCDNLANAAPPVADLCDAIRAEHRRRIYWQKQRLRIMGALAAEVRLGLGWSLNLPKPEREKIEKAALDLIKRDGAGTDWETLITMTKTATEPFVEREDDHAKECARLAETLPVWRPFGEAVRGFGAGSLAVIVGEAGDLSGYANPGKLWKRMGLAVFDGTRQGGLPKNAPKEEWVAHGYNRQRRSRVWNIGDAMIKAQVRKVKDADGEDIGERTSSGDYGAVYLERKAYELARDPEMQPIKAHRRAQRYMEKRLLKNLWRAWRRASYAVASEERLSAANSPVASQEAEREATSPMSTSTSLPPAPPSAPAERPATTCVSTNRHVPGAPFLAERLDA